MPDRVRYGYFMHPSRYDPPLGFGGMDVFLAKSDPERYFDAAAAFFFVNNGDRTMQVEIGYPCSMAPLRYQVAMGRFYLLAHNGNMVEGISLGGLLAVEAQPDFTHCLLTSPAPIFDIEMNVGLVRTLEVEIEAELARLRAEWKGSDTGFDCRVANLEPLILFTAGLNLLDDYLHNHPQAMDPDEVLSERAAVHQAIRTLQHAGQWPQVVPTLRDLILSTPCEEPRR